MNINELIGKTLTKVENNGLKIYFTCDNNVKYVILYEQRCCEDVHIDDISGDLQDLIGSPILIAEECSDTEVEGDISYSKVCTWSFCKIATIKGSVSIRWYSK